MKIFLHKGAVVLLIKRLLVLILLSRFSQISANIISGKVIDGATNDIIIGATVVTEKGNIGRDGRVVNAFFEKVNKHLNSK